MSCNNYSTFINILYKYTHPKANNHNFIHMHATCMEHTVYIYIHTTGYIVIQL